MARAVLACLFVTVGAISSAQALGKAANPDAAKKKPAASDPSTLLQADRLSYDQDAGLVTAEGHVEVARGEQLLHADKITYDQDKDVVIATGHVALRQPSGEVLFSDRIELTSDMKEAFLEKVGILFPDNSRLSAVDAQRFGGRYLIVSKGIYSSCSLCVDDPKRPPLWQMKGARITHDSESKDVIYRDATLEFDGIPVLYTPYFSHPDPTVERRQGFLTPSGGFSANIGPFVRTPYYFDLAPNEDLTVTPTFSTKDKAQMAADWRYRFVNGSMNWSGSFTHADLIDEYGTDKGYQWRGHLFGGTLFNLSDTWRAGTDVAFTSDKSYLTRYKISSEDLLVNRAFVEGFKGRSYTVTNVYHFEDERPGNRLAEPFVAPEVKVSALGEPGETLGGRWSFDSGLLVTTRDNTVAKTLQGANTRRLSTGAGWQRQLTSSTGFLTTISAEARADNYWADNVPDPNLAVGDSFSEVLRTRGYAQGDLSLRYPLGRRGDSYQHIIEPIAVLSVAPNVSSKTILPNEDSIDVEFDETNLFSQNRFTGIDKQEGGTRMAYGVRQALIGDNGARIEMLGGQIFRTRRNTNFPDGSGLNQEMSDYVGRLDFSPAQWLDTNYGFRLDHQDLSFQRQELQMSAGLPIFRPFVNYLSVKQNDVTTGIPSTVEEATVGASSTFSKYWTISASQLQAFKPNPGPRSSTVSLVYQDECFQSGITVTRAETTRQDIESGTSAMFHFYLKNLGGIHTDSVARATFQTPSLASTQGTEQLP